MKRFTYEVSGQYKSGEYFSYFYINPRLAFCCFEDIRRGKYTRLKIRELSIAEGFKVYREANS